MMLSFKSKEKDALVRCNERIVQHGLPMKLVEAEYTFDGSRLTFYFTAEERVDFRALVRDLAATFRTRIELRQIGARDQAKLQGGIGPCGKTLCCSSWITDFGIVSIKMAKEQGLPLNPSKISGVCGRLMCCLSYENDNYIQAKQRMPQIGTFLSTPGGSGKVSSINVPKNSVEVMLESGVTIQVPLESQESIQENNSCGSGSCSSGNCSCASGGPCTCGTKNKSSSGANTTTSTTSGASTPKGGCCVSCSLNKQNQ
jgi:cell fate regulator YaaT (PSP1 superfamily)